MARWDTTSGTVLLRLHGTAAPQDSGTLADLLSTAEVSLVHQTGARALRPRS
jgi:hypothetical protein